MVTPVNPETLIPGLGTAPSLTSTLVVGWLVERFDCKIKTALNRIHQNHAAVDTECRKNMGGSR